MKGKWKLWFAFIFVTEFIYMSLELIASRTMSPYFGTTLDVWTSIIGVILFASALGNGLGSRFVRNEKRDLILVAGLFFLGIWLTFIPFLSSLCGILLRQYHIWGSLLSASVLFLIPGVASGMIGPIVLQYIVDESELEAGVASGRLYSVMTCGGLFGTFATGFWLLPYFGAKTFVYMCAALAFACCLFVVVMRQAYPAILHNTLCSSIGIFGIVVALGMMVTSGLGGVRTPLLDIERDTEYGHVRVFEHYGDGGELMRNLLIDGGYESTMYVSDDMKYELAFEYAQKTRDIINERVTRGNVLCLGGGAYSIPKYLACVSGDTVDVVEIDEGIIEIAREYFGLNDAISESEGRLTPISGDGRVMLSELDKTYDVVFNDTFAGDVPARTLTTVEAVHDVKSRLNKGGLYVMNVIGKLNPTDGQGFLQSEIKTLESEFAHVYVFLTDENTDPNLIDNFVVVATDDPNYSSEYEAIDRADLNINDDTITLTDDKCPVEYLSMLDHR